MKDAFDVMGAAGASAAPPVVERLADSDAIAADAARVRAARRRRLGAGVGAGVGAVLVGVGVTWVAWPSDAAAVDVASARVAQVPVFDARADRSSCVPSTTPEPYLPWAQPGVTVAAAPVRDSTIDVQAIALVNEDAGGTLRRVDPGAAVDVPGSPSEGGALTVDFDVTWAGDALYTVEAAAFLVASGRVLSPAVGWYGDAEDREVSGGGSAVPLYDPDADTSSISIVSPVQPTCLAATQSSSWSFGAPVEAAELHTVVQVRDESGAPLATFVDGAGLDGTTVAYPGFLAAGAIGATTTQPTPTEVAAVRAARQQGEAATPSPAALVRDAVAQEGVPLSQAGAGIAMSGRCDVLEAQVERDGLELPVVAVQDDRLQDFPDQLPAETLRGSRSVDIPHNPGINPLRGDYTLLLLDIDDGAVEASIPLRLFSEVSGGPATALAGASTSCTDREAAPGRYQAVMLDADDRSDEALDLAEALQPVTARWYDLGLVTVLP
ncbi:hypothetical protein [Demequina activiva]|uniref:Uncharacterized protein n=1 Tax=Demequina activiva TaxID=1582364 RepID=A0A919Q1B6_9MICO|nr:hypothetical protein [Demequina activiva]GIG53819.1 hypothetical protein Dac01nite_05710 [Demequina activiva]